MSTIEIVYCDWPPDPHCRDCGRWNPDLIAARVKDSLERQMAEKQSPARGSVDP